MLKTIMSNMMDASSFLAFSRPISALTDMVMPFSSMRTKLRSTCNVL